MTTGVETGTALEIGLRTAREQGRKLLVPYVMGGLGEGWSEILPALAAAGADAVEVGIPFSDPMIDGPTIQRAATAALRAKVTPAGVIADVAASDCGVPIVVMTYYNIVFRAGHRRMARSLAEAGIEGAILPDLPLEESAGWEREAADAGIATVLLAAPTTPEDRLRAICRRSTGFVYAVGLMGVTGERASLSASARPLARRVKAVTDKPVLVGVGVSTPEQALEACTEADGVVVGSAVVRRLLGDGGAEEAAAFVADIRRSLDG